MFGIGGIEIVFLLGLAALAVPYFIPTMIASARRHPNLSMIVIINLLTGWTVVGWVAAFVWSLRDPMPPSPTPR